MLDPDVLHEGGLVEPHVAVELLGRLARAVIFVAQGSVFAVEARVLRRAALPQVVPGLVAEPLVGVHDGAEPRAAPAHAVELVHDVALLAHEPFDHALKKPRALKNPSHSSSGTGMAKNPHSCRMRTTGTWAEK